MYEIIATPGKKLRIDVYRVEQIEVRGGPGSGHHGHKGRPGEVGGSAPSGTGVSEPRGLSPAQERQAKWAYSRKVPDYFDPQGPFGSMSEDQRAYLKELSGQGYDWQYWSPMRPLGSWIDLPEGAEFVGSVVVSKEPLDLDVVTRFELVGVWQNDRGEIARQAYERKYGANDVYVFTGTREIRGEEEYWGSIVHPSTSDPEKYPWRVTSFDMDGFSGHVLYRTREEAMGDAVSRHKEINPRLLELLVDTERFQNGVEASLKLQRMNARAEETKNRDETPDKEVLAQIMPKVRDQLVQRGGPGSGHHGHKGRPGQRGGSLPSKRPRHRELSATDRLNLELDRPTENVPPELFSWEYDNRGGPVRVYHGTRYTLVDDILEEGLQPGRSMFGRDPAVYFTANFEDAATYVNDMWGVTEVWYQRRPGAFAPGEMAEDTIFAIIEFEITDEMDPRVEFDRAGYQDFNIDGAYYINEAIPPELIRRVHYFGFTAADFPSNREIIHLDTEVVERAALRTGFAWIVILPAQNLKARGGPGSGHHGHKGRPGEVGGSAPDGGDGGTPATPSDTGELGAGEEIRPGVRAIKVTPGDFAALEEVMGQQSQEVLDQIDEWRLMIRDGTSTQEIFKDPETGEYTEERKALHDQIIEEMFEGSEPVPEGEQIVYITGGYPGSGKSTVLREMRESGSLRMGDNFVHIDSDFVKTRFPEYDGWNAALLHEESSDVVARVIERAIAENHNVLYDATLKTTGSSQAIIQGFEDQGYSTNVIFVDIPITTAMQRAVDRAFGTSRRFVDPAYIATHNHKNINTLETVKPMVESWTHWDNTVPRGESPILLDSGGINATS